MVTGILVGGVVPNYTLLSGTSETLNFLFDPFGFDHGISMAFIRISATSERTSPPWTTETVLEWLQVDHMMLHHWKNPMCEHCQRGRMLKRYFHRVRDEPEEDEVPYTRPTEFGGVIEADNIFPSVKSRGIDGW